MRDDETAPRVRLHIVDQVKLPATTARELSTALDRWEIKGMPPLDMKAAIAAADLGDADIFIVEIVTEGATPEDLRRTFRSAELNPGDLVDAVRLLLRHESAGVPPFPFICLGDVVRATLAKAPLIERAEGKTLIAMNIDLQDDYRDAGLGWTDHCFVPARRCGGGPEPIQIRS